MVLAFLLIGIEVIIVIYKLEYRSSTKAAQIGSGGYGDDLGVQVDSSSQFLAIASPTNVQKVYQCGSIFFLFY